MSDNRNVILGTIRNARFLDIGGNRQVIGGTIYGHPDNPEGSTFYSEPIETDEGDVIHTAKGSFRYSRSFH